MDFTFSCRYIFHSLCKLGMGDGLGGSAAAFAYSTLPNEKEETHL